MNNGEVTAIFLGIDTGGTYTDAVLFDPKQGVLKSAKAPTTRYKLSIGIEEAVQAVLTVPPSEIELVSLSSTLATNSIVEGQGSPVCLLLIGYDPRLVEEVRFDRLVQDRRIVHIGGGHSYTGDEQRPLDIEAVGKAILAHAPHVSAFAVSGYFSVRNPDHELRVKELVRRLTNLPVTCGHELTSQLDAPRRAITVALNARLISLMHGQIIEVRDFLAKLGIHAPLMVVKGDGSLIDAEMALERPVETILSGPAASVIGATYLSGKRTGIVADIGGTTTDVAVVRRGVPALSSQGARVGGWQTMVEALDVHTTGLGGDSEVRMERGGLLAVGPRRVVPLCMIAARYPAVLEVMQRELRHQPAEEQGRFAMRQRGLTAGRVLTERMRAVWDRLGDGPLSMGELMEGAESPTSVAYAVEEMVEEGLVTYCAFTPTDAAHVLGYYSEWSLLAAQAGADLFARRIGLLRDEFCNKVVSRVIVQAGHILLETALAEEGVAPSVAADNVGQVFINRALGAAAGGNVNIRASLSLPVIGVGAPAATYLKPLAGILHTRLFVPEYAEVGNAVGAVVGGVVQTVRVLIRQPAGVEGPYRLFSPAGFHDFMQLEEAVAHGKEIAQRLARDNAVRAGADRVKVVVHMDDAKASKIAETVFLGSEITATAAGRPRLKVRVK